MLLGSRHIVQLLRSSDSTSKIRGVLASFDRDHKCIYICNKSTAVTNSRAAAWLPPMPGSKIGESKCTVHMINNAGNLPLRVPTEAISNTCTDNADSSRKERTNFPSDDFSTTVTFETSLISELADSFRGRITLVASTWNKHCELLQDKAQVMILLQLTTCTTGQSHNH